MQVLLMILGVFSSACLGFAIIILGSPYSRRSWAIWLLTTAEAMEAQRSARRGIEDERRRREDDMRVSYGIDPVGPFKREPVTELAKRA